MTISRKRGWWPAACGGVIAGVAFTLAVTGVGRGGKPDPDERWKILCDPAQPCPGNTPELVERCSCPPSTIAFRDTMCHLDRHVRQQVTSCLGSQLSLATLDAGTRSCIETRVEADPDAKQFFLRYADLLAESAQVLGKAWNDCYVCWSRGLPRGCDPEAKP